MGQLVGGGVPERSVVAEVRQGHLEPPRRGGAEHPLLHPGTGWCAETPGTTRTRRSRTAWGARSRTPRSARGRHARGGRRPAGPLRRPPRRRTARTPPASPPPNASSTNSSTVYQSWRSYRTMLWPGRRGATQTWASATARNARRVAAISPRYLRGGAGGGSGLHADGLVGIAELGTSCACLVPRSRPGAPRRLRRRSALRRPVAPDLPLPLAVGSTPGAPASPSLPPDRSGPAPRSQRPRSRGRGPCPQGGRPHGLRPDSPPAARPADRSVGCGARGGRRGPGGASEEHRDGRSGAEAEPGGPRASPPGSGACLRWACSSFGPCAPRSRP